MQYCCAVLRQAPAGSSDSGRPGAQPTRWPPLRSSWLHIQGILTTSQVQSFPRTTHRTQESTYNYCCIVTDINQDRAKLERVPNETSCTLSLWNQDTWTSRHTDGLTSQEAPLSFSVQSSYWSFLVCVVALPSVTGVAGLCLQPFPHRRLSQSPNPPFHGWSSGLRTLGHLLNRNSTG